MDSLANDTDGLENNSMKYGRTEQTERMWLRLRGMQKYKNTCQRVLETSTQRDMSQLAYADLIAAQRDGGSQVRDVQMDLAISDTLHSINNVDETKQIRLWPFLRKPAEQRYHGKTAVERTFLRLEILITPAKET
ncbi:hypothetical protein P4O66_002494 [Electrophorus voltai]|uniref:Uncharacterized protein n=1 Tax=Electrophorus voltai TaxID=2609070 RepID=A0AAD8YXN5_9TELE|nr:hypothetical protein P4O66_002494 [Electrophorus voltai]